MAGWQEKLLNLGGRRELVRSVLSAIPTYILSALRTPKQFTKTIDKARRRFFWAGNQQLHGGKCKVNWTRVQRPISRGGLGVTNLEKFSRALKLRWLWFEWHDPDKPWIGTELPVDDIDRALFTACTKVTVHNGKKASFWNSSWLNGISPATLFPQLHLHSKRKNRTVASALSEDNWIRDVAHNLSPPILDAFFQLWSIIDSFQPSLTDDGEDTLVWKLSADGLYSSRSAYHAQFIGGTDSLFPSKGWRVWAPAKCKIFLWLLLQDRVWTAARLQ